MTVYLFWGQEEFTLEQKISELKKKFVKPEFAAMSYKIIESPEFEELQEMLCTSPFMFGNVVLRIDATKYFAGGKKEISFSDKELKKLEKILEIMSENVHAIFVYKIPPNVNKKIDTRKKLYKIISKFAQVQEFPQFRTYDKGLVAWVEKQAKAKDISLNDTAIKTLIDTVGAGLRTLDNELEKLKILKHPQKEISVSDIKTICIQNDDIFKIVDLYANGKCDLALEEIRKINEKQHYLITFASLGTNVRNSINIKLLSEKYSPVEISRQTGMHEFRIKKELERLQKISGKKLLELKMKLTQAEYNIKSGTISSPELALELAFL